jgi:hypothetical protein
VQHTIAVKRIGRYLLATKDKGLIMKPNQEGMECWVDAAHATEWNNKTASDNPNSARSRMGYIITYAGCPMHWTTKDANRNIIINYRSRVHSTFIVLEGGITHHVVIGRC